jgi:hypothetical protein
LWRFTGNGSSRTSAEPITYTHRHCRPSIRNIDNTSDTHFMKPCDDSRDKTIMKPCDDSRDKTRTSAQDQTATMMTEKAWDEAPQDASEVSGNESKNTIDSPCSIKLKEEGGGAVCAAIAHGELKMPRMALFDPMSNCS